MTEAAVSLAPVGWLASAAHEAGHAVMAALFGAEIDVAEVWRPERGAAMLAPDGQPVDGRCSYNSFGLAAAQHAHLITAAGPVAEAVVVFGGAPTPAQVNSVVAARGGGRWTDAGKLQQYAMTAGGFGPSPTTEVLPLVQRCWGPIAALAVDMDDGKRITHGDVAAALGLSQDRSLHPFELANIRSGLRGVPDPRGRGR